MAFSRFLRVTYCKKKWIPGIITWISASVFVFALNGLWTKSFGPTVASCVLQTSDFGLNLSIQGQKVVSKEIITL